MLGRFDFHQDFGQRDLSIQRVGVVAVTVSQDAIVFSDTDHVDQFINSQVRRFISYAFNFDVARSNDSFVNEVLRVSIVSTIDRMQIGHVVGQNVVVHERIQQRTTYPISRSTVSVTTQVVEHQRTTERYVVTDLVRSQNDGVVQFVTHAAQTRSLHVEHNGVRHHVTQFFLVVGQLNQFFRFATAGISSHHDEVRAVNFTARRSGADVHGTCLFSIFHRVTMSQHDQCCCTSLLCVHGEQLFFNTLLLFRSGGFEAQQGQNRFFCFTDVATEALNIHFANQFVHGFEINLRSRFHRQEGVLQTFVCWFATISGQELASGRDLLAKKGFIIH